MAMVMDELQDRCTVQYNATVAEGEEISWKRTN